MAMMNRITDSVKAVTDISPEKYYFDEVRPAAFECLRGVKYDDVFIQSVELAVNKADRHAAHMEYSFLSEDFAPIGYVLLNSKSQYLKEPLYLGASQEEKDLVNALGDKVSQLITIIKCSKEPEHKTESFSRPRVGYDEVKKENVIRREQTPGEEV